MRAAILLLVLLFSMCGVQTRSTQTDDQTESQGTGAAAATEVSTQLDVSAELKELRHMVVELRVMQKYTQDEVKVLEAENAAMKTRLIVAEAAVKHLKAENEDAVAELEEHGQELAALKTRLAASEAEVMNLKKENGELKTEVEDLKKDNAAHEQELAALKTRLAASEAEVMNLKKENGELKTEVEDLKMDSAAHEQELAALKNRLAATETEVQNLGNDIKAAPKVAFSAGLSATAKYTESGSNDLNLVFSNVITNVGEAYSSANGFFTAPVMGVYYFRLTVQDQLKSHQMAIRMFKNRQMLMYLTEYDTDNQRTYLSGGLTLQLEKVDTVNLGIPAQNRLWGGIENHSTFSGFLLFPL